MCCKVLEKTNPLYVDLVLRAHVITTPIAVSRIVVEASVRIRVTVQGRNHVLRATEGGGSM
jgi:hypothetical protein